MMPRTGTSSVQTRNNFDLIRLFAAAQVAVSHAADWMHVPLPWLNILGYFPGVPIFFFISGYLIYQSYANIKTPDRLRIFTINRILRLFPALYICIVFSLVLTYFSGYFSTVQITFKQWLLWLATQFSFLQFFNPDFMRAYATGKLNASLWTITVELQFYVLTPLIFFLWQKYRKISVFLFIIFVGLNTANSMLNPRVSTLEKLFNVSFAPWIAMFALGAYISTNKRLQEKILNIHILVPLSLYMLSYYVALHADLGTHNSINFISFILLGWLIFKAAYTLPNLSESLLHKNDISYGIYIYHMPIVNFMIYKQMSGSYLYLVIAMIMTTAIALLSWRLIEKPALRLKKISLRRA
jgi:peptidoglycan/LPS O-acetylase OafA/YrhL